MKSQAPSLVIFFDNEIPFSQIRLFRGAVLSKVPRDIDVFHNHEGEDVMYRYPLIQYKRISGKAAIMCVGNGVDSIGAFFSACDLNMKIGWRTETFKIKEVSVKKTEIGVADNMKVYTIRKWLAFNKDNYDLYFNDVSVEEKVKRLEGILIGNMLSCCKGLDITVDGEIKCEIQQVLDIGLYDFKRMKMTGFDVVFSTNMQFPDYLGLGKGVSLGFGMIKQII